MYNLPFLYIIFPVCFSKRKMFIASAEVMSTRCDSLGVKWYVFVVIFVAWSFRVVLLFVASVDEQIRLMTLKQNLPISCLPLQAYWAT